MAYTLSYSKMSR